MKCNETNLGDVTRVTVSGRIDLSNADELKDVLLSALSRVKSVLVLDLSGVDYISSAGLRSAMIVFKAAKAEGKTFVVAALQPLVMEIFTISRFHLIFPLFATVREAVEAHAPHALTALDNAH
jgi:anti-anti-sigma factor